MRYTIGLTLALLLFLPGTQVLAGSGACGKAMKAATKKAKKDKKCGKQATAVGKSLLAQFKIGSPAGGWSLPEPADEEVASAHRPGPWDRARPPLAAPLPGARRATGLGANPGPRGSAPAVCPRSSGAHRPDPGTQRWTPACCDPPTGPVLPDRRRF